MPLAEGRSISNAVRPAIDLAATASGRSGLHQRQIQRQGKLLTGIIDPNREVAPNYLNYVIDTKDGDSLMGLIVNDSGAV